MWARSPADAFQMRWGRQPAKAIDAPPGYPPAQARVMSFAPRAVKVSYEGGLVLLAVIAGGISGASESCAEKDAAPASG